MNRKDIIKPMGELVRELRTKRGLTLRQLAVLSSTHYANLGNIERSRIGCGAKVTSKIADGLNLSPDERQTLLDAAAYNNEALHIRRRIRAALQDALDCILANHDIKLLDIDSVRHEKASCITLLMKNRADITLEVLIDEN